jgi:very-short-patch-repair endonuclease
MACSVAAGTTPSHLMRGIVDCRRSVIGTVNTPMDKGIALLDFLKASATLRRKRVSAYATGDKILWFADVPKDRPECRSTLLAVKPGELGDVWLEVRKKRMPARPPLAKPIADWVRADDLEQVHNVPELRPEITVLVDHQMLDPDAPSDGRRLIVEQRPELRRLADHPEIQDAWLEYVVEKWEPWAEEMRRWQQVQRVYEDLDYMHRRLEASEERYELLLAVGLLQWRDPGGTAIKRHLITGPAEISLDAARGILTALPAAAFDGFHIELDMLELQHQPRLAEAGVEEQLDELDIEVWDTGRLGQILRGIANRLRPDAQVDEASFRPPERVEERPRISYAPALVLRERRPSAYEDLVRKFLNLAGDGVLRDTAPWRRLLLEGEAPTGPVVEQQNNEHLPQWLGRYLFPLPANDEQRQIVQRLQVEPCVLVKGPPGTGKSQTIANLICHLLASGDRILVTAHAPRALAVLRRFLPHDVRDLCVTSLGSSREDQELLNESVQGILRRKNEWHGAERAQQTIDETERRLRQLDDRRATVERQLRESREAETFSHSLGGGYQGTAAQIARQLQAERERYDWMPDVESADALFPLEPTELHFFADLHGQLTENRIKQVGLGIGDFHHPDPDEFSKLTRDFRAAEELAQRAIGLAASEKLETASRQSSETLDALRQILEALEEQAVRAERALTDLTAVILADAMVGKLERWTRLVSETGALANAVETRRKVLGATRVEVPADVHRDRLRSDAERRRIHFLNGGRRGFSVFSPRLVKETRYVQERTLVDGRRPKEVAALAKVVSYLQLETSAREFERLWPGQLPSVTDPKQAAARLVDLASELQRLVHFLKALSPTSLAAVPASERAGLASQSERTAWLKAVEAETARRNAKTARQALQDTLEQIRRYESSDNAHPSIEALARAAQSYDPDAWRTAWEEREHQRRENEQVDRYRNLEARLARSCAGLERLLHDTRGDPTWTGRLLELSKAWAWSCTRVWLRRVSDPSANKELVREFHRVQEAAERTTGELASLRAWRVFFERLDEATVQSLFAWTKAVDRIGKGTGKHAYRHRRDARSYLTQCVSKMPAWVMPLHKLWDTVDARPGLFDTVIIDEASQAGIDSLALLLLAKRVIVVGDDKQNSPEAVGVLEEDIARLAREHLNEFRFCAEFRPDTSLFDHAERAFGGHISLREHFRCVPEIIRFSNDLCYRDVPLIPLRQAPPSRLPALKSRYVSEGACEGEGQGIRNRAEAEALVDVVKSIVTDEAYESKTIGVIALQGHAQAELIERLLAQMLDPKTMEERRLRCGEPATFQGDQRDIILLSLVIAPNVRSRALGRLPDQRRFNVAMSRARDQVWLFHSIRQHDLSPEDLRRRLLNFFERPDSDTADRLSEDHERLEREARGPRQRGNQPEPYESWFEVEVALELLRRKYAVRPQVETAGKRIDLVVEGVDARLAVECDGDEWHGAEQYEADMVRQRQLERAGWTFVRVRESDFWADREAAMATITDASEALGVYPVGHLEELVSQPSEEEADQEAEEPPDEAESTVTALRYGDNSAPEVPPVAFGPFSGYSDASAFPDPRDASSADVRAVLRRIVEKDGPLTRSSVYRLYVAGCPGLQRVGRVVRQALNRALSAMLRAGEIVQDDELADGSAEGHVVRVSGASKVVVRPAGERDLLEIPPSELLAVLARGAQEGQDDGESLLRGILDHYGYSRLTRPRRNYLLKVLGLWGSRGKDTTEGGLS